MNKKHVFWGVLFLLCAGLLLVDQLIGLGGFSFFDLIFGVILAAFFCKGVYDISFGEMLFSLAFLIILFDRKFMFTDLSPWTILTAALFGTIGLNLIFGDFRARVHNKRYTSRQWYSQSSHDGPMPSGNTQNLESHFHSETNFSSGVKCIHADTFTNGKIECNFGACEVYFDNIDGYKGNASLCLEANFGKITLFIPKHWVVSDNVTSSFGSCQIKRRFQPESGQVLYVQGEANFGCIELRDS